MVTGLHAGTSYFVIRAIDDVYQFSEISNVVEVRVIGASYLPIVVNTG